MRVIVKSTVLTSKSVMNVDSLFRLDLLTQIPRALAGGFVLIS